MENSKITVNSKPSNKQEFKIVMFHFIVDHNNRKHHPLELHTYNSNVKQRPKVFFLII